MIELGDLKPIRAALEKIAARENSAKLTHGDDDLVANAFRDARVILTDAIASAENPELLDGLTVAQFAQAQGISKNNVYKKIRRGVLPAKNKPGVGLIIPLKLAS